MRHAYLANGSWRSCVGWLRLHYIQRYTTTYLSRMTTHTHASCLGVWFKARAVQNPCESTWWSYPHYVITIINSLRYYQNEYQVALLNRQWYLAFFNWFHTESEFSLSLKIQTRELRIGLHMIGINIRSIKTMTSSRDVEIFILWWIHTTSTYKLVCTKRQLYS